MKTIEERAKEFAMDAHDFDCEGCDTCSKCRDYRMFVDIATEQKAIDNEELLKLKSAWEKQAQINHNDEDNYNQGYHDAVEKACNIFCHTGCPHKTDFYNCLNDKCDTWKIFKRMMEEDL